MANENFLEKLASQFGSTATVKNVFGEPIIKGDKTIIPVARIAYGLGSGSGGGKKKNDFKEGAQGEENNASGEGSGGGGGVYAKPKGVYEITPEGTRFIPASNSKQIIIGVAIGFLVKALFFSKK